MHHNHDMTAEIVEALRQDPQLQLKSKGKMLRGGKCPACNQPELFIAIDKPWQLKCGREGKCGYTESTRERYADLFQNISKRHPQTQQRPNAAADAYMELQRGFDPKLCAGMYRQEWHHGHATVRFPISGDLWWERIIDAAGVKAAGKKAHFPFGSSFKNKGWVPPGQTIEPGDRVWITEGIFKALGFHHLQIGGKRLKTISAMSCNNLPWDIINAHAGKGVRWILANDNEPAGIRYALKFAQELRAMGEAVAIALPEGGKTKVDWDDLWRAGRLTEEYLAESLWRGLHQLAETPLLEAFWFFARFPRTSHHVFNHGGGVHSLRARTDKDDSHRIKVEQLSDPKALRRLWAEADTVSGKDLADYVGLFQSVFNLFRISNCAPTFLYIERDALTDEQLYHFSFRFISGNAEQQVSFEGSVLESPASWNKALLSKTPGGTFDGTAADWKKMKESWFDSRINSVTTIPFVGYAKEFEAYIFPGFAYHGSKRLEPNDQGYIVAGKHQLKCSASGVDLSASTEFDGSWLPDFRACFGNNGLVLMAWWLGTLFAEQIRATHKSWPFLEYTGEPGAGKSSQIEFMWRLVGREGYEGFNPAAASHVGRARNYQQVANLPVVLLEGDAGAEKKRLDLGELKTFFNGRSIRAIGVAKRGATTDEPPFRGALLVSQNDTVKGEKSVLSRIVHCHVTKAGHTRELAAVAQRLIGNPTEKLCGWLHRVLSMGDELFEHYKTAYAAIEAKYAVRARGLDSRLILNHAQVAAWVYQLGRVFGPEVFPVEICREVEEFLWQRALARHDYIEGDNPFITEFWTLFDYVESEFTKSGRDREPLNITKDPGLIAFDLAEVVRWIGEFGLKRYSVTELREQLKNSKSRPFVKVGTISSNRGGAKHAWVFKVPQEVKHA
ncbi:MAG: hypothetical protein RL095_2155 [Verrucomicrobiota bacterium]|jgi:hypothetical protein